MRKTIEYETSLRDEIDRTSQSDVAKRLGITKGAVWLMLKEGREIYLRNRKGKLEYAEFKDFGKNKVRRNKKPRTA